MYSIIIANATIADNIHPADSFIRRLFVAVTTGIEPVTNGSTIRYSTTELSHHVFCTGIEPVFANRKFAILPLDEQNLAFAIGFEPMTYALTAHCSTKLS